MNKYTENKAKRNYNYDFTSCNANSYKLWTTQKYEIKQSEY